MSSRSPVAYRLCFDGMRDAHSGFILSTLLPGLEDKTGRFAGIAVVLAPPPLSRSREQDHVTTFQNAQLDSRAASNPCPAPQAKTRGG